MKVGIDALAFDIPKIYLPIETLAINRNIEPDKLTKGLGLLRMSCPDVHQDAVVLAANALWKLIENEKLDPRNIGRIYIGTESSVDAAKPIATYLIEILEEKLKAQYGEDSLNRCDALDMTFACIGGVDALQIMLDWVRVNPEKQGIVICSDIAKYDLGSGGEYTQGAGAVALLIKSEPRLLSFEKEVGVSTQGVFDFFKPRRFFDKKEITQQAGNPVWMGVEEEEVEIFKEQPIFDGQYSNQCYQDRVKEAYQHFKEITNTTDALFDRWQSILMHLPYAFQGRRMFPEIYALENKIELPELPEEYTQKLKEVAKSEGYRKFVADKLAPAEIASSNVGNIYTGSIFLGMISMLCHAAENYIEIANTKLGFISYGSGSKSKVFEATVEQNWKATLQKVSLDTILKKTEAITMETYTNLHKKMQKESIIQPKGEFILTGIEKENPLKLGARYYKWVE